MAHPCAGSHAHGALPDAFAGDPAGPPTRGRSGDAGNPDPAIHRAAQGCTRPIRRRIIEEPGSDEASAERDEGDLGLDARAEHPRSREDRRTRNAGCPDGRDRTGPGDRRCGAEVRSPPLQARPPARAWTGAAGRRVGGARRRRGSAGRRNRPRAAPRPPEPGERGAADDETGPLHVAHGPPSSDRSAGSTAIARTGPGIR